MEKEFAFSDTNLIPTVEPTNGEHNEQCEKNCQLDSGKRQLYSLYLYSKLFYPQGHPW